MSFSNTYIVIQAGGIGTRMWPLSTIEKPKQFYDLLSVGKTMLQLTYDRFAQFIPVSNIYVITHDDYADLLSEQLPMLPEGNRIMEPMRKNTAPGLLYAIKKISSVNPNAVIVQSNCDYVVYNELQFKEDMGKMVDYCQDHDDLMVIGVPPASPDPLYGYIQIKPKDEVPPGIFKVKTFTDSSIPELVNTFIRSGEFLWNTSLFGFRAPVILSTYQQHAPDLVESFAALDKVLNTKKEKAAIKKIYPIVQNVAFRFEILYKASNVATVKGGFQWNRVINFKNLWEAHERDYMGNAVNGKNVILYDSTNSTVLAKDKKLVVIDGLENYIVVDSDEVLLIMRKGHEENQSRIYSDVKRLKGETFL